MAKIGSPLFIFREECKKDLIAVIEKLAQIGYDGLDFMALFGNKPSAVKNKLDSCGIEAAGGHIQFEAFVSNTSQLIDDYKEIGCGHITVGAPPEDGMPDGVNYTRTLEEFARMGEAVNAAGMKLFYHNHAKELKKSANGKTILENILDDMRPDLLYCELDIGWIGIAGEDPAYYLKKYKDRCPALHFKDYIPSGAAKDGFLFRPTGYGVMDNAALYELSKACNPEWYIMDHDDAYERDSYFDLSISLDFFKNLMLVSGK